MSTEQLAMCVISFLWKNTDADVLEMPPLIMVCYTEGALDLSQRERALKRPHSAAGGRTLPHFTALSAFHLLSELESNVLLVWDI